MVKKAKQKEAAAADPTPAPKPVRMTAEEIRGTALPNLEQYADVFKLKMLREIAAQLADMNERQTRWDTPVPLFPDWSGIEIEPDDTETIEIDPPPAPFLTARTIPKGVYGQPANERKPPMSDAEIHAARGK